jgi:hypothetical protein
MIHRYAPFIAFAALVGITWGVIASCLGIHRANLWIALGGALTLAAKYYGEDS